MIAGLQLEKPPNDFQPFTTPELRAGPLRANDLDDKIVGPFEWTPIKDAYEHTIAR